jgi:CheY-like chemotaxis protein
MASGAAVLVVDDDAAIRDMVTMALQDEGYEVVTAVGAQALAVARALSPAVILLDIMMPDMDGIEVSRRLRADPLTRNIPIVAMSATTVLSETANAMHADEHLPKPFDLEQLSDLVARYAGQRH